MGTNYYAIPKVDDDKKKVMRDLLEENRFEELKAAIPPNEIHIGKSSMGWEFLFNHNNWRYWNSIEGLRRFLATHELYDEYQSPITPREFWGLVEVKKGGLHGKEYEERWDELHPGMRKPCHMLNGEPTDEEWFGLRFSTSTEFS